MNKIVTNSSTAYLMDDEIRCPMCGIFLVSDPTHDPTHGMVQVVPGFEDKAVVTMNQPPPRHDWGESMAKLAQLAQESAGLKPVKLEVSVKIEGRQPITLTLPKVTLTQAEKLRGQIMAFVSNATLESDREFQVGDK